MSQYTILYIEDHAPNVDLVRRMLKIMPYRILAAETAKKGLIFARHDKPDLILMDIGLPDMNGLDLTLLMKADEELRDIPIVAFTADATYGTYQRCIEAGCTAYLTKPVSRAALLRVIHQVLPEDA